MTLGADEQVLVITVILYLAAVAAWLLSLRARGKILLRTLAAKTDAEVWASLGAPATIEAAVRDPERRWRKFIKSGDYRRRLDAECVELIDAWRRRTRGMLLVFGAAGLALLVRFWPALGADLL